MELLSLVCDVLLPFQTVPVISRNFVFPKNFLNLLLLLPLHTEAPARPGNSHGLPKSCVAQVVSTMSPSFVKIREIPVSPDIP